LTQRRTILDGLIASHRGRIANTAGDSVLAEFGSAVDAVRCAVEAQKALAEANAGASPDRQINFRIGVHVGDVMVKGGDLFGDGVNIAARLQALSSAGGVCVSGVAHDQVRKILPFAFTDLGAQQVKNIEEPVRAFAVTAKGGSAIAGYATASVPLPLPDKPSIAVLPFQNMSGDPEQEYFADGVVEDILTALSRKRNLFVVARNSSFTYKGKPIDVRQVGRELGVRYVLEGSVRKAGGRVRITGQLIEAATGTHLWADKFEGALDDAFELQDKVTSSVVGAISPELERAEIALAGRKPTESLEAYDYYIRALARTYDFTKESILEAFRLTQKAIEIDPTFALSYALGANSFGQRKAFGWSDNLAEEQNVARRLVKRALELEKADSQVLAMAGQTHNFVLGEVADGIALLRRAISLDPNLASARYWIGGALITAGDIDEAIDQLQVALRLSPLDSRIFLAQNGMAIGHFFAGRYQDAVSYAALAVQQQPNYQLARRVLCASLAMLGKPLEARSAYELADQLGMGWKISGVLEEKRYRQEFLEKLVTAFRMAGVPE
jgi:TolB-like protein/Tfp pilus assembly protein PilF